MRAKEVVILLAVSVGMILGYGGATGAFGPGRAVYADPKPVQTDDKAAPDKLDRTILPIPEPKRPEITVIDARKAKAPPPIPGEGPEGRSERGHRADRRHGVRSAERVRWTSEHADGRETGQKRFEVQPVPYHRGVLSNANGAADGA